MLSLKNMRDTVLLASIDDATTTISIVNPVAFTDDGEEFQPYVLTLTRGMDYTNMLQAERVLVTAVDENDARILTVTRGYDGSVARAWSIGSNPVYCYMLFTAAYYDAIADKLTFLENKPIDLDLSNISLDLGDITTNRINIAEGLTTGSGLSIFHAYDQESYTIGVQTTSNLVVASASNMLVVDNTFSVYSDGIDFHVAGAAYIDCTSFNLIDRLTVTNTLFTSKVPSTFEDFVTFQSAIKLDYYVPQAPTDGTLMYRSVGDVGFYGWYNSQWNKLGFTAQILIGQEQYIYCLVDGNQVADETEIEIKDLIGTIQEGDTALIVGVPYPVGDFTDSGGGTGTITINTGLVDAVADGTACLILRSVSDALEGYTLRYSISQGRWVATSMVKVPSSVDGHVEIASSLDVAEDISVAGALVLGEHKDVASDVAGMLEFRGNNFYGTVSVPDGEGGYRTVQYSLIPDQAFEFLSAIAIPHDDPSYDGVMLRYDYATRAWLPTSRIRVLSSNTVFTGNVTFNDNVTFGGDIVFNAGFEYTERVYFADGISLQAIPTPTSNAGRMDYDPSAGRITWWGKDLIGNIVQRNLDQIPYIEDIPTSLGTGRQGYMLISDSETDGSDAHWNIARATTKLKNGTLRFGALMSADDPSHVHPWSDLVPPYGIPNDFESLQLGKNDAEDISEGKFTIKRETDVPTTLQLKFDASIPAALTGTLYSIVTDNVYVLPSSYFLLATHKFQGDVEISELVPTAEDAPYRGGRLTVQGTIKVGDNTSTPEPGMIRYHTYNSGGVGDLQAYCTVAIQNNAPVNTWLSLTSGLPRPIDQDLGGTLYFDEDTCAWTYTDQIRITSGILHYNLQTVFRDTVYFEDEVIADYIKAGYVTVGESTWSASRSILPGTLKYDAGTLYLYKNSLWVDISTANQGQFDELPAATVDGAVFRYNLGAGVWETTAVLTLPADTGVIQANSDLFVTGALDVSGNTILQDRLTVTNLAWFKDQIQLNVPHGAVAEEGRIRYNGDFEGYVPDIGWVSFTRRFDASLIAPATAVGQYLVSREVVPDSGIFNWVVSDQISQNDAVFTIAGDSLVTGYARLLDNCVIGKNLLVGAESIVVDFAGIVVGTYAQGEHTLTVTQYSHQYPPTSGQKVLIDGNYYDVDTFESGTLTLTTGLFAGISGTTPITYGIGAPEAIQTTATGIVVTNINLTNLIFTKSIAAQAVSANVLMLGPDDTVDSSAVPGALKYENNEFFGLYADGNWRSIGAYDIRDYFEFPETRLSRSVGDILAYDGQGKWAETNILQCTADRVHVNVPILSVKRWLLTGTEYLDSIGTMPEFSIKYSMPNGPREFFKLSADQSVLHSSLYVDDSIYAGGVIRARHNIVAEGLITAVGLLTGYSDAQIYGDVSIGGDTITEGALRIKGDFEFTGYLVNTTIEGYDTFDNRLDGSIWIGGAVALGGSLDVLLGVNLGDSESWSVFGPIEPAGDEPYDLTRTIVLEQVGNIFARRSIYAGHYIVPGHPSLEDYYAPKGAIRYTSEGENDRGDWEGWDGENWRSMTGQALVISSTHLADDARLIFGTDSDYTMRYDSVLNAFVFANSSNVALFSANSTTITINQGLDLTSKLTLHASTSGTAYLRLIHGVAPTTPEDGDVWTTTGGMYVRINGVTQQLGTGSGATLWEEADIGGHNVLTPITNASQIRTTISNAAPLIVSSTIQVDNLNVNYLQGGTWASPGTIGSTSANTGKFTTLMVTGKTTTLDSTNQIRIGTSCVMTDPPIIGGTTPNAAYFTTVNVNSTLTASSANNAIRIGTLCNMTTPPAIGGVTPNIGAFTTLSAASTLAAQGQTLTVTSMRTAVEITPWDFDFYTTAIHGILQPNSATGASLLDAAIRGSIRMPLANSSTMRSIGVHSVLDQSLSDHTGTANLAVWFYGGVKPNRGAPFFSEIESETVRYGTVQNIVGILFEGIQSATTMAVGAWFDGIGSFSGGTEATLLRAKDIGNGSSTQTAIGLKVGTIQVGTSNSGYTATGIQIQGMTGSNVNVLTCGNIGTTTATYHAVGMSIGTIAAKGTTGCDAYGIKITKLDTAYTAVGFDLGSIEGAKTATGIHLGAISSSVASATQYGIKIDSMAISSGTQYGLYVGAMTGGTKYGVYVLDAACYFGTTVTVGTTLGVGTEGSQPGTLNLYGYGNNGGILNIYGSTLDSYLQFKKIIEGYNDVGILTCNGNELMRFYADHLESNEEHVFTDTAVFQTRVEMRGDFVRYGRNIFDVCTISPDTVEPEVTASWFYLSPQWTTGHNITNFLGGAHGQEIELLGGGTDHLVRLNWSGGTYPTSGTFKLIVINSLGTSTTAALNYNCTAEEVTAAILALQNMSYGGFLATGGPFPATIQLNFPSESSIIPTSVTVTQSTINYGTASTALLRQGSMQGECTIQTGANIKLTANWKSNWGNSLRLIRMGVKMWVETGRTIITA